METQKAINNFHHLHSGQKRFGTMVVVPIRNNIFACCMLHTQHWYRYVLRVASSATFLGDSERQSINDSCHVVRCLQGCYCSGCLCRRPASMEWVPYFSVKNWLVKFYSIHSNVRRRMCLRCVVLEIRCARHVYDVMAWKYRIIFCSVIPLRIDWIENA